MLHDIQFVFITHSSTHAIQFSNAKPGKSGEWDDRDRRTIIGDEKL